MPGDFSIPVTVTRASLLGAAITADMPVIPLFQTVLDRLQDWEGGKTFERQIDLMLAVGNWIATNERDFKKRDKLSGGLCKKFAIQCGQDELRFNKIPTVAMFGDDSRNSHLENLHGVLQVHVHGQPAKLWYARNPPTRIEVSKKSIMDWMSILNRRRELAVILIDVQSTERGVKKKWDGSTKVLNHMIKVLKKANELALPVFEFWMGQNRNGYNISNLRTQGTGTILDLRKTLHKPNRRNEVYTLRKPSHNIFDGDVFMKKITGVGADGREENEGELFDNLLLNYPTPFDIFVVMGFSANHCVGASIFGGFDANRNYKEGLLDRGYNILTSRSLLASEDDNLQAFESWPYMGPCQAV